MHVSPSSSSATAIAAASVAVLVVVAVGLRKNHDVFILQMVIRKCHKCLERNLVYFILTQFFPRNAMSQPPIFDSEY